MYGAYKFLHNFWSFPILSDCRFICSCLGWGAAEQGTGASLLLHCRCDSHIVGSWEGGTCTANTAGDGMGAGCPCWLHCRREG